MVVGQLWPIGLTLGYLRRYYVIRTFVGSEGTPLTHISYAFLKTVLLMVLLVTPLHIFLLNFNKVEGFTC